MNDRREVAALLFMGSVMMTLDAYSSLNSSPWTAESFGADPARVASLREYVTHAIVFSMLYAVASSVIAESPLPVIGALTANVYLVWLYRRASERGRVAGNGGWANGEGARSASSFKAGMN
jgi:hypothetical protein